MCLTAIFKPIIAGPAVLMQCFLSSAIQIRIAQYWINSGTEAACSSWVILEYQDDQSCLEYLCSDFVCHINIIVFPSFF